MPTLQLITFDLDNTLWATAEVIPRAEQASSDYLQQRFPEIAEQLSVPALHQLRDRMIKAQSDYWTNLTKLRTDLLTLALTEAGIDKATAAQAAADGFEAFYVERNRVNFFEQALDVLSQLGEHHTLGAMSNGNANLDRIGIRGLFDFHLNAEGIGAAKPDAGFFDAALTEAGVNAADALHIGDHPLEDVEGARRSGLGAIWANIVQQPWPDDLPAPQHQVSHLADIPTTIKQIENANEPRQTAT